MLTRKLIAATAISMLSTLSAYAADDTSYNDFAVPLAAAVGLEHVTTAERDRCIDASIDAEPVARDHCIEAA